MIMKVSEERKRKALSDLAKHLLGVSETICDGWVGPSRGCAWTHPEDNLASQGLIFGSGGWVKKEGRSLWAPSVNRTRWWFEEKPARAAPPVRTKTTF